VGYGSSSGSRGLPWGRDKSQYPSNGGIGFIIKFPSEERAAIKRRYVWQRSIKLRCPKCQQEALLGWEMKGKFSVEVKAVAQQR
jgi:hypothetical protein